MRRIFFLLLFIGMSASVAHAQKEFATIETPMRQAEDLVSIADEDGYVCVYFFQGGKLNFHLLSPTGEQLSQQQIPWRWSQPQVLGTRVTDDEFIFYSRYINGRRDFVRPFALNKQTGTFRSLQDVELKKERHEVFVGGFVDKDHYYMLYSDKKGYMHLYRDAEDQQVEKKTFDVSMFSTKSRQDRERELIFIHPDLEQTVHAGHHRSKIYTRDDLIHMVFDGFYIKGKNKKATTEILTLDWNTGKTAYRTLPDIEQRSELNFNSFLYNNTLFRLHLDREQLNLTAYDFATLQPVKEYKYAGNEPIDIKATPVQQRGSRAIFSSDKKVLEESSKIMKNLASGVPAITVDAFSDSTLQLTIGSYQPPNTRNNTNNNNMNRMVRTPDRYIQTSRGLMMVPGRWLPAYAMPYNGYYYPSSFYRGFYDPFMMGGSGGGNTGPGISTYFRAVLDAETLNNAAPAKTETVVLQDKLEEYEHDLKPEPTQKTLYRYKNKLHYGYYDRRANTFKIVEFAQQQPAVQ